MPNPDDKSGDKKVAAFAQGVGFVVFSGIAFSVLKSLNPFNRRTNETQPHSLTQSTQPILDSSLPPPLEPIIRTEAQPLPLTELTQPIQDIPPPPPPPLPLEPINQKPYMDQNVLESSADKTVEIVRGDTLWGLSTKYGVSIDEIKEANGLSGDTIQVGKKLIIP